MRSGKTSAWRIWGAIWRDCKRSKLQHSGAADWVNPFHSEDAVGLSGCWRRRWILFGGCFYFLQQLLQVCAREVTSIHHDRGNFLSIADIVERGGVQQNHIGQLARFDGAELTFHLKEASRIEGGGLQCFERRESCGNEALQFFVQAESGENIDTGWSVGTSEERHAGFVQHLHDLQFLINEFLARLQIIGVEILLNLD